MPDIAANVPESVTVVFPRLVNGVIADVPYIIEVDGSGHAGTHIIYSTVLAEFQGGDDPENLAELDTLASQIASDWYAWRLSALELRLESCIDWIAEGMHDIEYVHGDKIATHIYRSKWEPDSGRIANAGEFGSEFDPPKPPPPVVDIDPLGDAIWANCTLSGSVVTVEANDHIPVCLRLSQGRYIFLFSVDFLRPQNFTWSYNAGTTADSFKEVTRTSSSVTVEAQSGNDADGYFGIDVHGTFTEPGSGSGTPGDAKWYCMDPPGDTNVPQECEPLAIPHTLFATATNRLGGDSPGTSVGCSVFGETIKMTFRGVTGGRYSWQGAKRTSGPNGICSILYFLNIYTFEDNQGNLSCKPHFSGTLLWPGGSETISYLGREIIANAGYSLGIPTNIVFETPENDDIDMGKYTVTDT